MTGTTSIAALKRITIAMGRAKAPTAEEYDAIANALKTEKQVVVCLMFGRSKNLVQRIAKEAMLSKKTASADIDRLQQLIAVSGAKTPSQAANATGCSINQAEYILYKRIYAKPTKQAADRPNA